MYQLEMQSQTPVAKARNHMRKHGVQEVHHINQLLSNSQASNNITATTTPTYDELPARKLSSQENI